MLRAATRQPWESSVPTQSEPEHELVARAKDDPDAFALLYARYVDAVYRYCLRRLGDADAAEDAASLVFISAFANLRRCNNRSFRSWLFTIAHNVIVDRYRGASKPSAPLDDLLALADAAPTPEDLAIASDERRTLAQLLTHLTPDQQEVVALRLAGLTGPEIAQVLGRSHDAVKKLQGRAILRLRDLMGIDATPSGGAHERR